MRSVIKDLVMFHIAADVPILDTPQFPSSERIELRNRLLTEEYTELQLAIAERNITEVADALGDMIYVIVGTALEFGIPLESVWNEIQRSNMSKIDPSTGKVRRREDGKILKPDGWTPPNIKAIIDQFSV